MQSGTYKRLPTLSSAGVTSSSRALGLIHRARITPIVSLSRFRIFENGTRQRFCMRLLWKTLQPPRGKKSHFRYRAVRGTSIYKMVYPKIVSMQR